MNTNRIFAMIMRDLITLRHNLDRLSDMFYWPIMDLFIWGLTGLYVARQSDNTTLLSIMLTGLIFWLVVWRSQYEMNMTLLSELWDRNLVNILASPLTVTEWVASSLIFGFVKMIISIILSGGLAFLLYHFNIFLFGLWLIPFVISLLLTGWVVGFFVAGLIIRFGLTIQTFAWSGVFLLAPFSALYYSLTTLPSWAQTIARFVPSSYILEGMREILFTGNVSYDKLFISFALNIVYLVLSIWFFVTMFNKSKKLGLGRLI